MRLDSRASEELPSDFRGDSLVRSWQSPVLWLPLPPPFAAPATVLVTESHWKKEDTHQILKFIDLSSNGLDLSDNSIDWRRHCRGRRSMEVLIDQIRHYLEYTRLLTAIEKWVWRTMEGAKNTKRIGGYWEAIVCLPEGEREKREGEGGRESERDDGNYRWHERKEWLSRDYPFQSLKLYDSLLK